MHRKFCPIQDRKTVPQQQPLTSPRTPVDGPWHSNKNTPLPLLGPQLAVVSGSLHAHVSQPQCRLAAPPWSVCKLRMADALLWPCGLSSLFPAHHILASKNNRRTCNHGWTAHPRLSSCGEFPRFTAFSKANRYVRSLSESGRVMLPLR